MVCVSLGAVWLGGCSIALGGPDATRAARVRPSCDTSKTLVKVDGTTSTGLGLVGLALLPSSGSAASVFLVSAALYAAAALRGNNVVERCREDYERFDQEVAVATPRVAPAPTSPPVRVATPAPVASPVPPPVAEAAPASTTHADDPFHVAVGEQAAPATPTTRPAPPSATTSPWRDFWREVP